MSENIKKILIVEDEVKITEILKIYLEDANYTVFIAEDGEKAIPLFDEVKPDLVVLDLMLPKISGESICKAIRQTSRVPIIMLTAKSSEEDKISGFAIGADDYLTKPFSPRELLARVQSVLRRSSDAAIPLYNEMSWNDGDLVIDFSTHDVKKKGIKLNITATEFKILASLMRHPQKIFSRDELINTAFGMDFNGFERAIDSHIKNLRNKIEDNTAPPRYILTVRGVGYKFGGEPKTT